MPTVDGTGTEILYSLQMATIEQRKAFGARIREFHSLAEDQAVAVIWFRDRCKDSQPTIETIIADLDEWGIRNHFEKRDWLKSLAAFQVGKNIVVNPATKRYTVSHAARGKLDGRYRDIADEVFALHPTPNFNQTSSPLSHQKLEEAAAESSRIGEESLGKVTASTNGMQWFLIFSLAICFTLIAASPLAWGEHPWTFWNQSLPAQISGGILTAAIVGFCLFFFRRLGNTSK